MLQKIYIFDASDDFFFFMVRAVAVCELTAQCGFRESTACGQITRLILKVAASTTTTTRMDFSALKVVLGFHVLPQNPNSRFQKIQIRKS